MYQPERGLRNTKEVRKGGVQSWSHSLQAAVGAVTGTGRVTMCAGGGQEAAEWDSGKEPILVGLCRARQTSEG